MEKMWAGRTDGALNSIADDFNSSIRVDSRMYKEDILGSIAHATMLSECGILTHEEADTLISGLAEISADISEGRLIIPPEAEDIHMFVEATLTERVGDVGKKLHTARSRNDQVATDTRLYMRGECENVRALLLDLIDAIVEQAEKHSRDIMPGYTHLQRAQPIVFAHYLLAYAEMLRRDVSRLDSAVERMNYSPLGACALAGTTYPVSRARTAELLGFTAPASNSIDAVSDRDFAVELLSVFSILMMHLSRFSEEIILYSSWEFGFIELDDAFTTGSSIMPQKKNSDMAELVRGKCGRVYGDLVGMLTVLKGLPLAYNKDMQEDKEGLFDALDTVKACLRVCAPMIRTMRVNSENMYKAANRGFINATDLADYLTKRGVPFRTAYKITGTIVRECVVKGTVLDELPLSEYKKHSEIFDEDLYSEIALSACVERRISEGGTGFKSVDIQIENFKKYLKEEKTNI